MLLGDAPSLPAVARRSCSCGYEPSLPSTFWSRDQGLELILCDATATAGFHVQSYNRWLLDCLTNRTEVQWATYSSATRGLIETRFEALFLSSRRRAGASSGTLR